MTPPQKRALMPRRVRLRQLHGDREPAHCQGMMTFTDLASVPSHPLAPFTGRLRLAVAAYLARFKGISRNRTESDLRCYLAWCAERGLDPLAAQRPDGLAGGHPPPARARPSRRPPDRQGASAYAPPHICHDHARRWR
jgi:hypothetical protein